MIFFVYLSNGNGNHVITYKSIAQFLTMFPGTNCVRKSGDYVLSTNVNKQCRLIPGVYHTCWI